VKLLSIQLIQKCKGNLSKIKKDAMYGAGEFILIIMARGGYSGIVKKLIKKGVDIHTNEDKALRYAAEYGHLKVVKCLVEAGADIHANEDQALRCAAEYGHVDIVKYLIEKGADVHVWHEYALKYAIENKHLEVVKLLVENGANVNEEGVLSSAAAYGDLEIVKYLVEHGAANNWALRWAVENEHTEIVKLLIERGADINVLHLGYKLYKLWKKLPNEKILPFLVSKKKEIREAAKKYLERRKNGSNRGL